MSHTPGPWKWNSTWKALEDSEGHAIDDSLWNEWDFRQFGFKPRPPEEVRANQLLQAAAPEMDGALDKLIFELDSITWDSQGPPSTLIDALEDARAVRAKARGES